MEEVEDALRGPGSFLYEKLKSRMIKSWIAQVELRNACNRLIVLSSVVSRFLSPPSSAVFSFSTHRLCTANPGS